MRIRNRLHKIGVFAIVVTFLSSCGVLEQVGEMNMFSKCKFRLASVQNIELAGIDIGNMDDISDLGLLDAAMITKEMAGGELPLSFTLSIEVNNPNDKTAALNKLDWILFIDDIQMLSGVMGDRVEIGPRATENMPVAMTIDLMEALSGESGEAVMNFGFNLAGIGNKPTRFMLKAKPTIMVGNTPMSYPGYISVREEFTSGD